MAKDTTAFKTGMTVLRGGNVPAYTLEYLTPGKRKNTGEFETIVVPYTEMGRAATCTVQYGDDYLTVSRKHAAIERRGNEYFLIHLSQTNPTLINGNVVAKEAVLKNGDEIQLSMEGPRLRFNATPTGTANMGFTRKISLVTRQAIKPYRTLVFVLLILLIIIGGTAGWFIYDQNRKVKTMENALMEAELQRKEDSLKMAQQVSEQTKATSKEIETLLNGNLKNIELIKQLNQQIEELKLKPADFQTNGTALYEQFKEKVYFLEVIDITIVMPDNSSAKVPQRWTGTAFLCSDGKLVTARHCIQGWRFSQDKASMYVNFAECNGGEVFVKYRATSMDNWFEFDYNQVVLDDKTDKTVSQTIEAISGRKKQNIEVNYKFFTDWGHDWAYYQTDMTSNIEYDKELSMNLKAGERIYVLGFSLGKGGPSEGKINPLYSESSVGQQGLSSEGLITITSRSFEQGNSGGPAFVKVGDKFKVVGIVSRGEFDATNSFATIAYVCPINNIN
jgi:hypothetical protein